MSNEAPRLAFVINPIAGGGRALRGWDLLRGKVPPWLQYEEHFSHHPGHAVSIARQIAGNDYDSVVTLGGDGTIHEVVNGLMQEGMNNGQYTGPSMGIIPLGRGNDLARTFKISTDPLVAWGCQRAGLATEHRLLDIGILQTSQQNQSAYFVNICGAGLDADVAATANRLPRFLGGTVPYLVGVLAQFIRLRFRCTTVRLTGVEDVPGAPAADWATIRSSKDGGNRVVVVREQLVMTAVGIGRYLGGGMMLLPHNIPGDGFLDVMLVRSKGRVLLLKLLAASFKGQHLRDPDVAYFRARSVSVTGPVDTKIHADGDPAASQEATFEVLPRTLPVLF